MKGGDRHGRNDFGRRNNKLHGMLVRLTVIEQKVKKIKFYIF